MTEDEVAKAFMERTTKKALAEARELGLSVTAVVLAIVRPNTDDLFGGVGVEALDKADEHQALHDAYDILAQIIDNEHAAGKVHGTH